MTSGEETAVRAGDLLIIASHRVGQPAQFAEVLEVIEASSGQHYRVRWDDGHESIFFPGSDAAVRHSTRRRQPSPTTC